MNEVNTSEHLGIVSRRKAREAAMQALYQCDSRGEYSVADLEFFFQHFFPESHQPSVDASHENYLYARRLVEGVMAQIAVVDTRISEASIHWSLERMARTDRNILRVAVYEMIFIDEVPVNVAINEAIEIAKRFCSPESPVFVNGVLDQVAKTLAGQALKKLA